MTTLEELADSARVQIIACDPPLGDAPGAKLVDALDKLLRQFAREERVDRWAVASVAEGALMVIAWEGAGGLSGCSNDKIAKVLAAHESPGQRLLDSPPIVVEVAGVVRCCDRRGLRDLAERGEIDARTPIYDRNPADLGVWRRKGRVSLGDHPIGSLLGL